jgi:uracil-DNA glycosylase
MLLNSESGRRAALVRLASAYETDNSPALTSLRRHAGYVPGRGSVFPKVVIVGEAPGRTEDRLKRPFCGPSGKVLDTLLASIELSRDDVYITNAVKYRPVDEMMYNRTPSATELAVSKPYLSSELQIVGATHVLVLGKQPLKVFLGNRPHDVVRARWRVAQLGQHTYNLLPLYHPAVAVYQRGRLPLLIEEFQVVKERI